MDISLTVVDAATGARADVTMSSPVDAPLGDVLDALAGSVGRAGASGMPVTVDGAACDLSARLACGPLRDGCVVTIGAAAVLPTAAPMLELRIVAGSGAGGAVAIGPGVRTVGRASDCDLRLADARVSRRHLQVETRDDGTRIADLGSANGTTVEGVAVGASGADLGAADYLRIGDTVLALGRPEDPPADTTPAGARVLVNRPPRLRPPDPAARIELPAPPHPRQRTRISPLTLLAPLALGVTLAAVIHQWQYLLFTAMSPVLVVAQAVSDRRAGRRADRVATREYDDALRVAKSRIGDAVDAEQRRRRESHPDPARVRAIAEGPRSRLWERRPDHHDFLSLRLGLADLVADVEVVAPTRGEPVAPPTVRLAPAVVRVADLGVIGLAGADRAIASARALLGQAAALHSPRDLNVALLTDRPEKWQWLRWLPHARSADGQALLGADEAQVVARIPELNALVQSRRSRATAATSRQSPVLPAVLVVLDGARRLRSLPGVAELLADGPAAGVHFLCLDSDERGLPQECRAAAQLEGSLLTLRVDGAPTVSNVVADLPTEAWAERVARALAPLFDAGVDGAAALPSVVRWSDVARLPLDDDSADRVVAQWSAGPTTGVTLGSCADGTLTVDLRRDGPHALVAGTTGAGKSELLRSLVAGLAAANRPDQMTFVLVDYKGGAAFGPCARLPHVVGLVTDLDPTLTERALVSLSAELRRRETLLASAGVAELDEYDDAARRRGLEPLPRLMLVVDEFATLAEELPEFVGGLVGIAQRGRSLGVHLVLATQRPEGVVSNDIRANTNLRICLAVTRDTESRDVIDAPDAARISRTTPGRGYIRRGHGDLTAFQTARISGTSAPRNLGVRVTVTPFANLGDTRRRDAAAVVGPDDLETLVAACREAARRLAVSTPPSPWLAPLPSQLHANELPMLDGVVFGTVDRPELQCREPLAVDIDRGAHLLVAGAARSGRTTTLRTLAVQAARHRSSQQLHLYAIDAGGGGLLPLTRLPQCGAVVPAGDVERLDRLLTMLAGEVTRRLALLASHGAGTVDELRARGEQLPSLLVLVDRWDALQQALQDVEGGRLLDTALRLLADGPAAGLSMAISSDRSALVGRLSAAIEHKLVLRLADPGDYALVGLPAAHAPGDLPPGRAFVARTRTWAQVALLAGTGAGSDEIAETERVGKTLTEHEQDMSSAVRPRQVGIMPAAVGLGEIAASAQRCVSSTLVTLGVGGLGPDRLEVDLGECATFTIAGARGSGRSTALAALAEQLQRQQVDVVAVTPRRSVLRDHTRGLVVTDPTDDEGLRAAVSTGRRRVAVLVDDVELLSDSPLGDVVEELARTAHDGDHLVVVVAGALDELSVAFRGPAALARRSRAGLVLRPTGAHDGELLGARLPRSVTGHALPPGRGALVLAGSPVAVQIAQPSHASVTTGSRSARRGQEDIERLFDRLEVEMAADTRQDVPDPSTWATGDEPPTERQERYLATLAREADEAIPADLTKAEASARIDSLREETGRT